MARGVTIARIEGVGQGADELNIRGLELAPGMARGDRGAGVALSQLADLGCGGKSQRRLRQYAGLLRVAQLGNDQGDGLFNGAGGDNAADQRDKERKGFRDDEKVAQAGANRAGGLVDIFEAPQAVAAAQVLHGQGNPICAGEAEVAFPAAGTAFHGRLDLGIEDIGEVEVDDLAVMDEHGGFA